MFVSITCSANEAAQQDGCTDESHHENLIKTKVFEEQQGRSSLKSKWINFTEKLFFFSSKTNLLCFGVKSVGEHLLVFLYVD